MAFIELSNVTYKYEKSSFVLGALSLELDKGEVTAITGANGSGKTTLGKLIAGILRPTEGVYLMDGRDTKKRRLCELGVGYLFQNPNKQLFTQTAEEEIAFPLELRGEKDAHEQAAELLKRFGIEHLAKRQPRTLSRGEKQRLAIAAAMAAHPGYMVLDEPSTALDEVRRKELYGIINELRESGAGLAIITHDRALVETCACREIHLERGRVVL